MVFMNIVLVTSMSITRQCYTINIGTTLYSKSQIIIFIVYDGVSQLRTK